jgi:glycosyltransferase involved in cell wall biosynthesis
VDEVAQACCIPILASRAYGAVGSLKIHLWAPAFTGFGGGIASFSRALAGGLRALGHEVRLYGKMDVSADLDGLRVTGTGRYTSLSRSHIFASRVLASAARHRPDYIISTHVNFGPVALLANRLLGTRYALVAHGIDIHPALKSDILASLRGADRIVAVSTWTRLRVLDLGGIEPEAVAILPNTFDESRFFVGPRPEYLAKRYGIRPDERVILTVARLAADERYKGYDRIVHALPSIHKQCGPVRFILVGKGEDQARIHALSRVTGSVRQITLAGFVSDTELADHYRLADVFAMPSTGEGFGIVFLEAMGCGTPVVAGNRDGSVDALDQGRLGCLVDPNDVGAISDGIEAMLTGTGPQWWFDRAKLSSAVRELYGQQAFRCKIEPAFQLASNSLQSAIG